MNVLKEERQADSDLISINQEIITKEKQMISLKKRIGDCQPSIITYQQWENQLHALSQKRFKFTQFKEKAKKLVVLRF